MKRSLPWSMYKYSMKLPWNSMMIPWNSKQVPEVSMELHRTPRIVWERYTIPWSSHRNARGLHGIPWNSIEVHGIPGNSMKFHGVILHRKFPVLARMYNLGHCPGHSLYPYKRHLRGNHNHCTGASIEKTIFLCSLSRVRQDTRRSTLVSSTS